MNRQAAGPRIVLAIVSACLFVLTLVTREWIERRTRVGIAFRIPPGGGRSLPARRDHRRALEARTAAVRR
jgi:hypothetical protein